MMPYKPDDFQLRMKSMDGVKEIHYVIECDATHGARKHGPRNNGKKWWLWRVRPLKGSRWNYFVWTERGFERYSPSRQFDNARFVASPCIGWADKWPNEDGADGLLFTYLSQHLLFGGKWS